MQARRNRSADQSWSSENHQNKRPKGIPDRAWAYGGAGTRAGRIPT